MEVQLSELHQRVVNKISGNNIVPGKLKKIKDSLNTIKEH